MATKKNETKKSGFNAPAYGNMLPDNAKIKLRKDGGFDIVYPKGQGNKKK